MIWRAPAGKPFALYFEADALLGGHQWGILTPWFGVFVFNRCIDWLRRRRVTGFELAWAYDERSVDAGGRFHRHRLENVLLEELEP